MRKELIDTPKLYDTSKGEIVDFFNGEVEEDHYFVSKPAIRASDYAEWESRRQHEVLIPERDKRLYAVIRNVGEKIGAPKWLVNEVFRFYKSIPKVKAERLIYKGDLPKTFKAILAVYYLLSHIFGVYNVVETIRYMDCSGGAPCFANKKKHDEKFLRYVSVAKRFALHLYREKQRRKPEKIVKYYASKFSIIPDTIVEKAVETAKKYWSKLHTRKDEVVFATAITLACIKEFKDKELCYVLRKQICRKLHILPYIINNVLKELEELE